jgi:hypothetical protein
MRRPTALTLILLILLALTLNSAFAQQVLDYQVRSISQKLVDGQVSVDFTIVNPGSAVTVEETVYLFDSTGRELDSVAVEPLNTGESARMTLSVPAAEFPSSSFQSLYVVVGVDQLPPASQRSEAYIGVINVFIPPPLADPVINPTPSSSGVTLPGGIRLPAMSLAWINLSDPLMLVLIFGLFVIVFIIVFVLVQIVRLVLRLFFPNNPTMTTWQPPYVITPLIDPNSTNGRRQQWQLHAESDTLPAPCAPGSFMVRKLLIGSDGVKLGGWHVSGVRISQYDRYGRVARSQIVLPRSTGRALDKAVRKSPSLDDAKRAENAVRAAARGMTGALLKKNGKHNATLPVAFDIRFTGMHGEVRILFELYGCNAGAWQEIDHWEPEMRVVNGSIQENFTYTVLGQYPQENFKQFRQRLEGDIRRVLAAMVQSPPPMYAPVQAHDTTETQAITQ